MQGFGSVTGGCSDHTLSSRALRDRCFPLIRLPSFPSPLKPNSSWTLRPWVHIPLLMVRREKSWELPDARQEVLPPPPTPPPPSLGGGAGGGVALSSAEAEV